MVITSTGNPYARMLKSLHTKKGRAQHGLFLVEGVKMVEEALGAGVTLHSVAFAMSAAGVLEAVSARAVREGVPVYLLDDRVLAFVSDAKTPQGVIAAVQSRDLAVPDAETLPGAVVALERVQDPGNMGTIIRTAEAAGAGAVVLSFGCCEPFSPKAVRGAMGSVLRIKIYEAADFPLFLYRCRESGYSVVAGSLNGENMLRGGMPAGKYVLLTGNESGGLSDEALACATHRVRIPMAGRTESLNAGVATGILLYELQREKLKKA